MAADTTIGTVGGKNPADDRIDPKKTIGFMAMVFGMFMAILDIQIVSASLSEIQAGLGASTDEISWVQISYLIAEVIMIPLSGFWDGFSRRACCLPFRRRASPLPACSARRPPISSR